MVTINEAARLSCNCSTSILDVLMRLISFTTNNRKIIHRNNFIIHRFKLYRIMLQCTASLSKVVRQKCFLLLLHQHLAKIRKMLVIFLNSVHYCFRYTHASTWNLEKGFCIGVVVRKINVAHVRSFAVFNHKCSH